VELEEDNVDEEDEEKEEDDVGNCDEVDVLEGIPYGDGAVAVFFFMTFSPNLSICLIVSRNLLLLELCR
jgi:hypothetical protein